MSDLQRAYREIKELEEDLEEKINKLNLSGNPDDWILANGTEQVRMGLHRASTIVKHYINSNDHQQSK